MKLGRSEASELLAAQGDTTITVMNRRALEVKFFQPEDTDRQQPHSRDEVYVVASGRSHFQLGTTHYDVAAGDLLFVPAGHEHRFTDFSDEFSTWVFFHGPEAEEAPNG